MQASKYPDRGAHSITAEAMEMAHDIKESERFVEELLGVLRRELGFESAFAGGPALGRSMVTVEVAPRTREGAVRFLEGVSAESSRTILALLRHRFECGVCLEWEPSERKHPPPYRELMTRAGESSMACLGLGWRGAPLAFIELARYGGESFSEEELELLRAIKPGLEAALMANLSTAPSRYHTELTPREREIAELVCRGLSNREIGRALSSSPHTVRNQTVQIFRKAGVENRTELTALLSSGLPSLMGPLPIERWLLSFRASA